MFTKPFVQAQIKEDNQEVPRHWPSCGQLTSGQRILRTKG